MFWPNQQMNIELDSLHIKLVDEVETNGYQTKDFKIVSHHTENELSVRFIFCPSWPHHCSPLSSVTDLPSVVQTISQGSGGPLVIVDRFGGTEAAMFCAVMSLLHQLDFEDHVDIYEYCKVSHMRRPGIWRSQDEYFHMYRIADSIVCASMNSTSPFDNPPLTHSASMEQYATLVNGSRMYPQAYFINGQPSSFIAAASNGGQPCNGQHTVIPSQHGTLVRIPPDGRETMMRSMDTFMPPQNNALHQQQQQQQQQQQPTIQQMPTLQPMNQTQPQQRY